eukprot:1568409-Amphidinium_carterae.1
MESSWQHLQAPLLKTGCNLNGYLSTIRWMMRYQNTGPQTDRWTLREIGAALTWLGLTRALSWGKV